MSHTAELQDRRERLSREMRDIVNVSRAQNRAMTSAERERVEKLQGEYHLVEARELRAAREVESDRQARIAADLAQRRHSEPIFSKKDREANQRRHSDVFSQYLRVGAVGLSEDDRKFLAGPLVGSNAGNIPVQNAQTVTTTGGGYLVPQGFSDELEVALKWYLSILGDGNCGQFTTATGAPLNWPTVNDTAQRGHLVSINTQLTETDAVLSNAQFGAYIFSSDAILVPRALVEDSWFNLDEYLGELLGVRLGRALNYYMTTGTGSSQPTGIVTAAVAAGNVVTGATGESASITYSDLVNVIDSVDPAYRYKPSSKWMWADSTLKTLRKMVDSQNRPIWQAGLTAGSGQMIPETVLDYPYTINNDMPAMAPSAYPIIFGDLSRYKVRRVASGTTVMRLDERYADSLDMGYQAWLRADGNLIDAGTHPLAVFQNSAS